MDEEVIKMVEDYKNGVEFKAPPTEEEVKEYEEILFLTQLAPWDPYSDVYARNEEAMVDHEGTRSKTKTEDTYISHRVKNSISSKVFIGNQACLFFCFLGETEYRQRRSLLKLAFI